MMRDPVAEAKVGIVGRALMLGTVAGLLSGMLGGGALGFGTPNDGGGAVLGGILGAVIGVVLGGILAPFVLRKAMASGGVPSRQDRAAFGAAALIPVLGAWWFIMDGERTALVLLAMAVALAAAVIVIFAALGWCFAPARSR